MLQDLGIEVREAVRLYMDATAGMGIAQRRGVGRIRHIHTPSLWLQRAVRDKRVQLDKTPGKENPADLGTVEKEPAKHWAKSRRAEFQRRRAPSRLVGGGDPIPGGFNSAP